MTAGSGSVAGVPALTHDVAVLGGGGAGLSVVVAIDRLVAAARAAGRDPAVPRVVVVDPVRRSGDDRTWCFWDRGASPVEACVHRAWTSVEVRRTDGRARVLDLAPLRYVMVRSRDFYALADAAARRLGVERVEAGALDVVERDGGVEVSLAGGGSLRVATALDSRPAPPVRPARTAWLQHFRGWQVRFDEDVLAPDLPVLMDFAVPQPERAVAFGYVLPDDARSGLVEYTQFSRARLPGPQYDDALAGYLAGRFPGRGWTVEAVEDGAIPMTDAVHARRVGRRVVRLGTAGGATRPSTGYTFAAMQRQAEVVAAGLLAGGDPLPPRPYPLRHRWMDAVLLRALDAGHVAGADLLADLFERNPPSRVLRFLDGATSPAEDLALMATSPTLPMLRAGAGDTLARLRGRLSRPGG